MQAGSLYGLVLRKTLATRSATTPGAFPTFLYSAAGCSRPFSSWPLHHVKHQEVREASVLSPAIAAAATARRQNLIQQRPKSPPAPALDECQNAAISANGALPQTNGLSPSPQYESDLIVVLDMDECLVHSKFFTPHSAKYAFQMNPAHGGAIAAEDCGITMVDTFHLTLPDGGFVKVHKRPFLQEFLQHTTQRYETHIFTAAMSIYAAPLLDRLEEKYGIQLPKRWYREHCLEINGLYIKDLSRLDVPPERTVLVDNNPYSFLKNPSNGILVTSFYQDPQDNTLPAVADLLYDLEKHEDVRPTLKKKFGLEQALRQNGL